jgi:putative endonuclease
MYYVYVLLSESDGNFYIGFTSDLKRRMIEHQNGESKSTKHRRPLELIYYEACRSHLDAMKREKYLKTTYGHRYLKNRLSNHIKSEM